jgi:hypothetical protein
MNSFALKNALESEGDSARRMEIIDVALCPLEPQLLDTCILQNLDWVDRQIDEKSSVVWDNESIAQLSKKYGSELANDLIDLGILYKTFEYYGSYPWLISEQNLSEISQSTGDRQTRLRNIFTFFGGHQDDLACDAYPAVSAGLLRVTNLKRVSPLLLRGLGISCSEQVFSAHGPLSFLPDEGDRRIAGYAILANIPVVLTTDRSTFWKHRTRFVELGLTVLRPTELLELYEPYWAALSEEFGRRNNIIKNS